MPTRTDQIQGSTDVGPLSDTRAALQVENRSHWTPGARDPQLRLSTQYNGGLQRTSTSSLI